MALFEQFTQIAGSLFGDKQSSPVLKFVVQMLSQGSESGGGLGNLIQNFQNNGLGDIVSSWVGTGENRPISADQIRQGLGGDTLQRLAAQIGLSPQAAGSQLAELLPNLIDKLTPGGEVPESGALEQVLSVLQNKFK